MLKLNTKVELIHRNVIENNDHKGCTYKEFLACNPKEFDGNEGAVVYTGMSWDNIKVLMWEEFCPCNERKKLKLGYEITPWSGLAMLRILIAMKPTMIQSVILKVGVLTHEAIRNWSIKKNPEKRVNGADYSFVSTTFILLLGIEPSDLGYSYEIEIVSEQLVEIDKSNYKAEIICHKKVFRIPLLDDKVLRVIAERLEEKIRHLRSAKTKEQKQEEIVVVRDNLEVFLNDLLGLPPFEKSNFGLS
nr:hypothetical protein [Tanacetum cinerariifolium]